jgi:hypothetical protein
LPLYVQIMLDKLVNVYYTDGESPSSTFCMFFPRLLKTQFGHQVCCNVHAFVFVIESAEDCLFLCCRKVRRTDDSPPAVLEKAHCWCHPIDSCTSCIEFRFSSRIASSLLKEGTVSLAPLPPPQKKTGLVAWLICFATCTQLGSYFPC